MENVRKCSTSYSEVGIPQLIRKGRFNHIKPRKRMGVHPWVLLIPGRGNGERGTGNGERGTGNRERESGNECTAVIRIRIQNGGRNHGKGSGN